MIKNLIEYQEKDKKRLELLLSVEGGRNKREINAANKIVNDARATLLELERDAKDLTVAYAGLQKNLTEHLDRIEKLKKSTQPKDESEIQISISAISTLLQKVNSLESQLENVGKNIASKTKSFEEVKAAVMKAQSTIKTLTPQYQAQLDKIKPQLDEVESNLKKLGTSVDGGLLDKYKARRKTEPFGKITDIVVSVANGRCGACYFEMPLSMIHKISTNGYITCEECGKILHNGK